MGLLERLPDNALPAAIRQRMADVQELKGAFQSLGSTSVRTHRIFSAATYDIQFNASTTPGTMIVHEAEVEFIPDDMTLGGAFCHRVLAEYLDLDNAPSNNPYITGTGDCERLPSVDGRQRWRFYFVSFGYVNDSVRLKFHFYTTGSGTFTTNVIT